MALKTLQAAVAKTAAFNGAGVDISGWGKPFDIKLRVTALTAGKVAIFALQTSNDAFSTDTRYEYVWSVIGAISNVAEYNQDPLHDWQLHGFRAGTSSVTARIALIYIDGTASVTYDAFAEGGGVS